MAMDRQQLRKQAYDYIRDQLSTLQGPAPGTDPSSIILLEDLRQLREGIADPSPGLVVALKRLLRGVVMESEIEAHIVTPFRDES